MRRRRLRPTCGQLKKSRLGLPQNLWELRAARAAGAERSAAQRRQLPGDASLDWTVSTFPSLGCKGARQATGERSLQSRQRQSPGHKSSPETPPDVADAPGDRIHAAPCRRQATPPCSSAAGSSLRGQTFLQALGPNLSRVTVAHPGPRRALIFGEMSERKEGRGKGKGKKKDRGSRGKPVEGDPNPGECQPLRCSQAST